MDAARHVLELCTPTRPRDTHSAISALIAITQKSKIKFKLCLSFTRHSPISQRSVDSRCRRSWKTLISNLQMRRLHGATHKSQIREHSFLYVAAAQAWNRLRYQLPTELRQLRSTPAAFKLSLKTFWFTAV